MASPGRKCVSCGHVMAAFDQHSKCIRRCDKGLGSDPYILKTDCRFRNLHTSDQKLQLATPMYKARKEKKMASLSLSLVDSGFCPDSRAD